MEAWRYPRAQDFGHEISQRLRRVPREPDMLVYGLRCLCALLIRFWLRVYHRFTVTGLENLPARGSFVVVANHTSHLDAPCLLSSLPVGRLHRAYAAAADDYFFATIPRLIAVSVVVNALPFDRKVDPRRSLEMCRRLLQDQGIILIFFPEGTRSLTG